LRVVAWVLMMVGCLALTSSPWLPWESIWDGSMTTNINGFNMAAVDSLLPNLQSIVAPSDDGTLPPPPSLSSIPDTSGGTDQNARFGIFVLVLGVTALCIAPWTLGGAIDRRRSMTFGVSLLGGLAFIPLLHDLVSVEADLSNSSGSSLGIGLFVGLAGALATVVGSAMLYGWLRRH